MSVSSNDNNIKIWNFKNQECILNLTNFHKHSEIYSSCFLKNNNQILIVTNNYITTFNSNGDNKAIKLFNIKGKYLDSYFSKEKITFIDIFYDDKNKYIIAGNDGFIESFIYYNNRAIKRYEDCNNNLIYSIIINYNDEPIKLTFDSNIINFIYLNFLILLIISYKVKLSKKFIKK